MVANDLTAINRVRWEDKPVLREIYFDLYRSIASECQSGLTLEVGGGVGNLKEFLPNVISTDISFAEWLDAVADAQSLPGQQTKGAQQ